MRRVAVLLVLLGLVIPSHGGALTLSPRVDGLGACTSSDPPYPFHGSCGTFNDHNTFYGSYGPGFPSDMGWGFCAYEAAHGGWYPAPGYNYSRGNAPAGADSTDFAALGWAFSEADRLKWWTNGKSGSFDADDIAVVGKLLYDNVVWGAPLPTLSGSLRSAMTSLRALFNLGITRNPTVRLSLVGGGTTIYDSGTLNVKVLAQSTNDPVPNQTVRVVLAGAVSTDGGATIVTVTTDINGAATIDFTVPNSTPGAVGVAASATLAKVGMVFYEPGMFPDDAQILASANEAASDSESLALTALGPPTGTIQIHKTVDDGPYYPATGATFEIRDTSDVLLDTLIVDATGYSNVSVDLEPGTYTLKETVAPTHYGAMSDRSITVSAGVDAILDIGPSDGDVIARATLRLEKVARGTTYPLAGAVFTLTFDATNSGVADGESMTCTTDATGACTLTNVLPGNYWLVETTAPANYLVSVTPQWVTVQPGDILTWRYEDDPEMTVISLHKYNAELHAFDIPHATYDLYVMNPAPPTTAPTRPLDAPAFPGVTFMARGVTDSEGRLAFAVPVGYRWCYHEVSAPAGYVIDPSLHCSRNSAHAITADTPRPEHSSPVRFEIYKFDQRDATAGVPGAYYALFVRLPYPRGFQPPPTPSNIAVPPRYALWAIAKTNTKGQLGFSVPGGNWWCVKEIYAPQHYRLDPSLHCTSEPLVRASGPSVTHIAIAEDLAGTGGSLLYFPIGAALTVVGFFFVRRTERDGAAANLA